MNKIDGWIKIHRRIIDSDIYQMPPLYLRVFERLIIEANHQDNEIPYRDKTTNLIIKKLVKRGERLTSVRDICRWVAWYERGKLKEPNPKTIQSILNWLENNSMIFVYGDKGNRKETHYSIANFNVYQKQDDDKSNRKVTEEKQLTDTNKNVKNDKNVFNNIYAFWNSKKIIQHQNFTDSMQKSIGKRLKDFTEEQILQAISNYDLILKSDEYFWNYKWSLKEFLDRGLEKFLDLEVCKNNFKTKPKSEIIVAKSTNKFHNFEQTTGKKSEEELQEIAERKNKEKLKKLGVSNE